jgi:hypothetical protein
MSAVMEQDWTAEFVRLEHHIAAALEYSGGTHTVEDIYIGIASGQFQFWPLPNSAVVTEIVVYPRKKVFNYFLVGGKMDELEALYPITQKWAKSQGCHALMGMGRVGWSRSFLKSKGFDVLGMTIYRELT